MKGVEGRASYPRTERVVVALDVVERLPEGVEGLEGLLVIGFECSQRVDARHSAWRHDEIDVYRADPDEVECPRAEVHCVHATTLRRRRQS